MLNPSQTSDAATYYNRERPSILNLVEPGPNEVLDLGCGAGHVGRRLRELGKASQLVGVELFADAAERAREHYATVHCGDIEEMELPYQARFDYVICGDILEHLKDPYQLVKRIHGWLKPRGRLIVSVPNVRHWSVFADLAFRGVWEYRDAGIMDRTHLRFFTKRTCFRMLTDAGFEPIKHQLLISGRRFRLMDRLTLGLFREFLGSQTVVLSGKRS